MKTIVFCVMLLPLFAHAVIETYEFEDEALRERYHQFIEELRCPKCQNQNLSGSNSPISEDLRRELYRLLNEEQSDEQIIDYMVGRYGDFILYRPRFNPETAILWLAPAIFLLLGVVVIAVIFLRQKKMMAVDNSSPTLDETEQQQLQQLLSSDNHARDSRAQRDDSNA